jgi:hypothetical protein
MTTDYDWSIGKGNLMPTLAKRKSGCIAPTYPQPGNTSWQVVSTTIRPLYSRQSPVSVVQKLVGVGDGLDGTLYLAIKWIRSPDHPALSKPLYQPPIMTDILGNGPTIFKLKTRNIQN